MITTTIATKTILIKMIRIIRISTTTTTTTIIAVAMLMFKKELKVMRTTKY